MNLNEQAAKLTELRDQILAIADAEVEGQAAMTRGVAGNHAGQK